VVQRKPGDLQLCLDQDYGESTVSLYEPLIGEDNVTRQRSMCRRLRGHVAVASLTGKNRNFISPFSGFTVREQIRKKFAALDLLVDFLQRHFSIAELPNICHILLPIVNNLLT